MIPHQIATAPPKQPLTLDLESFDQAMEPAGWWWSILQDPAVIAAGLLAILAASVAWAMLARNRRDRAAHGPALRLLMRRAGLTQAQQAALRQMAHALELSSPGPLLISRGCFDAAAQRLGRDTINGIHIQRLRTHLFQ